MTENLTLWYGKKAVSSTESALTRAPNRFWLKGHCPKAAGLALL